MRRAINNVADFVRSWIEWLLNPLQDWLLTVILAAAFVLALSLMGNKAAWGADPYPEYDRWGYRYPIQCRQDLTFLLKKVPLEYTSLAGWAERGRFIGYFRWGGPGPKIFVERTLTDPKVREEVIHHELCHAYMYFKYGDARWHPE